MCRPAWWPIIAAMSTVVLIADQDGSHVVARPARLRERLAARWRPRALERELARGAAPDSTAALALRAQALIGSPVRAALAGQLRAVLRDVRRPVRVGSARVRPRREEVVAAQRELERLADRLLAPDPVSARGVARVRLLLGDGCGPLYAGDARVDLRRVLARALEDVEVPAQGLR
jgi:hypothetical protein